METTIIAYVPVIHQGYIDVLQRYSTSSTLFVLDNDLVEKLGERKDIRALEASSVVHILTSLGLFKEIKVLKEGLPTELLGKKIVLLNDAVCKAFMKTHIPSSIDVEFDTAFLRWDKDQVFAIATVNHDRESSSEFDRSMMKLATEIGGNTSDWWRQIGSVITKHGEPILQACNRHVPDEHAPYFAGDPRDQIPAGERGELASAIHAEEVLIAQAARKILEGTDIYVTTFPCPRCAKVIAEAGIRRCFYKQGHVSLDGEQNLKGRGVEIILVK